MFVDNPFLLLFSFQKMLENYGITPENATNGHHKITLKCNVVEMAKEWPLYFARLYIPFP